MFDFSKMKVARAEFMRHLKQKGIQTQVHYIPVYTQPFYKNTFDTQWGDCPCADDYYAKCVSIPLFPAMTQMDVEKVISEIKKSIEPKIYWGESDKNEQRINR